MREIPLTQGAVALVDDEDYEAVSQYRWNLSGSAGCRYARAHVYGQPTLMHRFILRADRSVHVDHINGDGLDNRRQNLRHCTQSQNRMNSRVRSSSKTGYKGVTLGAGKKRKPTWRAELNLGGRSIHLGTFDSPEAAARAYDAAAFQAAGEFARLNFPESAKDLTRDPEIAKQHRVTRRRMTDAYVSPRCTSCGKDAVYEVRNFVHRTMQGVRYLCEPCADGIPDFDPSIISKSA